MSEPLALCPAGPRLTPAPAPGHNDKDAADERLLQVSLATGSTFQSIPLPVRPAPPPPSLPAFPLPPPNFPKPLQTTFAHDSVRVGDRMFIADTGDKGIREFVFDEFKVSEKPMSEVVDSKLQGVFTTREHVNCFHPIIKPDGTVEEMWVNLHSKSPGEQKTSKACLVNVDTGEKIRCLDGISSGGHQLVGWSPPGTVTEFLVTLDSNNSQLCKIDPETGSTDCIWTDPGLGFLKGLVIIDGVA